MFSGFIPDSVDILSPRCRVPAHAAANFSVPVFLSRSKDALTGMDALLINARGRTEAGGYSEFVSTRGSGRVTVRLIASGWVRHRACHCVALRAFSAPRAGLAGEGPEAQVDDATSSRAACSSRRRGSQLANPRPPILAAEGHEKIIELISNAAAGSSSVQWASFPKQPPSRLACGPAASL